MVQSSVAITQGSGTAIAVDTANAVDYQQVKLQWGAYGTVTDVAAASPMPVVQTGTPALPTNAASETGGNLATLAGAVSASKMQVSGNVGGFSAFPAASKTRPANTTAYAVGQIISESTSAGTNLTFANAVRSSGSTGTIYGAMITDSSKQSTLPLINLWLFNATLNTTLNDAAAFAPNSTDLANLLGVINLTTFYSANANGVLVATGLNIPFKAVATSIYGVLTAANAYTPTSAEVFGATLLIGQD